jgi:chromosome segregation ATPase
VPFLPLLATPVSQYWVLIELAKEIWLIALGFTGTLITLYTLRKNNADKEQLALKLVQEKAATEHEARLKKIEEENHANTLKHQSAQLEREKLVDANNIRMSHLENKVSQVDTIVHEVNALKSRMDVQAVKMDSLDGKLNDLRENLKTQFGEVMYLLKERRDSK